MMKQLTDKYNKLIMHALRMQPSLTYLGLVRVITHSPSCIYVSTKPTFGMSHLLALSPSFSTLEAKTP